MKFKAGDIVRVKTMTELRTTPELIHGWEIWGNDLHEDVIAHLGKYFTVEKIAPSGSIILVGSKYSWSHYWIAELYKVKLDEDLFTL